MADDPAVVTPTDATPTPGWSAKLILFGITILGLLPTSGLLDSVPWALKVSSLVMAGLGAIGYLNHSTSLKTVHAAAEKRVQLAKATARIVPPTDPAA